MGSQLRLPGKKYVFVLLIIFIAMGLMASLFINLATSSCSQGYRDDLNLRVNGQLIKTELAQTPAQLSQGLSGKSCIGKNQAMLFKFGRAGYYPFWMKGMRFPIDIIWINANREVAQVTPGVSPKTYPASFSSSALVQYVLEVRSGQAANLNIQSGDSVKF